jgi:hypothetical protein
MTDTATEAKPKSSKTKATEAPAEAPKAPRSSAIITEIDFDGVDETALEQAAARRSPWDDTLDNLYAATEAGKVGSQEDGSLKFVKIGSYATGQSAKAQIKAFTERKLTATYEFKVAGKDLFVRVIETA